VSDAPLPLPAFTSWPTFPFEGELRVKQLADPVDVEPPRHGEDPAECTACRAPDSAYIWVSDRWRVRALDRPTGLPMVLILESRSHLDMGDLPNLLAAELGVLTVRLERAIRSLDDVARVHVNRWGDGSAHLHVWFLARPIGRLQLRGTFLSLWDDILPRIPEQQWRENLAHVAAWLADFGGEALAEPPHIDWQTPAELHIPGTTDIEDEPTDEEVGEESDDAATTKLPTGDGGGTGTGDNDATTALPSGAADRDGVTTVVIPGARSAGGRTERSGTIAGSTTGAGDGGAGNGDLTVNLTSLRSGGETINLSEVGSGETIRFPMAAAADTDNAATMRFATGGGSLSGAETMVFPTGDAMDASRERGGASPELSAATGRAHADSDDDPDADDADHADFTHADPTGADFNDHDGKSEAASTKTSGVTSKR
jgi:hypothetical protein